ncbi:MAG: HD domain-containing protein [bacterium]|nr:HD domain-containing protein [bacterium]
MKSKNIQQVEDYVKSIKDTEIAHDFMHVDRVRNWALQIAREENFKDLEIVEIAALMHDIGLSQAGERITHGAVGASMAAKFLGEKKLLAQERIDEICNAIRFHNKNREGEGRLLEILRDADTIDLSGAIGIMRAFLCTSSRIEYDPNKIKGETWGMGVKDFNKRFDNGIGIGNFIIDQPNFQISCYGNLSTKTAKEIVKPLAEFMRDFIKQFEREVCDGREIINKKINK